jgi:hypothetical protein
MLLVTASFTRPAASDVKSHETRHFHFLRIWAVEGNYLVIRVCVEALEDVWKYFDRNQVHCYIRKYRPLELSATNLVTCITESYCLQEVGFTLT